MKLVSCKNHFNITKNIHFEAIQNDNKSKWSRLEQRSVIKFLVTKNCKPHEILEESVMCKEACFSFKNVLRWAKHGFARININQKDSPWSGNTLTLS